MSTNLRGCILLVLSACGGTPDESSQPLAAEADVEVEYIAHASFLLRAPDGTELLLDPYASRVWLGYDWPDGIEPDAILITHPLSGYFTANDRGRGASSRGDSVN